MNKHKEPSEVAQNITNKFSTNQNIKFIEIWPCSNVQFGNDTLSRSQKCKRRIVF